MNLKKLTLEAWLKNPPKRSFNRGKEVDYFSHYSKLKEYLLSRIHKEVTTGANVKKTDELLNNHGTEHIEKVIEKASNLVECNDCVLSAQEVYLLLSAIQLHDVGNILGRNDHEIKLQEIMLDAGEACARDDIERILIRKIAQAHGGKIKGVREEKDTIGQTLSNKEPLNDETIRARFLASILRFADELSDDKSRASITLLNKKLLPKRSEVFHAYAACLESVLIKHKENLVELYFKVPKKYVLNKFGKLDEEIYLVDEIYNRVIKMHRERIYCMRFCKKFIDIEKIVVRIDFYADFIDDKVFQPISFTLSDSGYPQEDNGEIYALCPSLIDREGNPLNGDYIKNKILCASQENLR